MNTSEDYLENVFEKENPLEEHLPLKPIKIWFSLLGFTVLLYSLKFFFLEEISGLYALTFFSASGLLGVCAAWMLHPPSRTILVKLGLAISTVVFIIYFIRAANQPNAAVVNIFSGAIAFFVLPVLLFITYYLRSQALLKRQKEISDGLFSIRQTPLWLSTLKSILSLLVILLGLIFMSESPIVALLVILLGLYYRFWMKGLDVNTTSKEYLFYTRHFWKKRGRWQSYDENSSLSIATPVKDELGKFKQEAYKAGKIKNARLFLSSKSDEKPKLIYRFTSSELPFREAQDLADKMGITLEK